MVSSSTLLHVERSAVLCLRAPIASLDKYTAPDREDLRLRLDPTATSESITVKSYVCVVFSLLDVRCGRIAHSTVDYRIIARKVQTGAQLPKLAEGYVATSPHQEPARARNSGDW